MYLFLGGMAAASCNTAGGRLVSVWFPPQQRGLAMGIRHYGAVVRLPGGHDTFVVTNHPNCCGYTGSAEDTARISQAQGAIEWINNQQAIGDKGLGERRQKRRAAADKIGLARNQPLGGARRRIPCGETRHHETAQALRGATSAGLTL